MNYKSFHGDSLDVLKSIPSNSIESLVTDPPAGIGLCNLAWDSNKGGRDEWIRWLTSIMHECHRTLKPGAHGFIWAIPRTSHWTATALEDAGFLVKDVVTHVFGSGFPKSIAIDKALRRVKYTDTELLYQVTAWIRYRRDELGLSNKDLDRVTGVKGGGGHWTASPPNGQAHIPTQERWERLETLLGAPPEWMKDLIRPARDRGNDEDVSDTWKGWGTSLKPASEHWILVQKPMTEHNVVANIRRYQTGAIDIDSSRIPVKRKIPPTSYLDFKDGEFIWDAKSRSRTGLYTQHSKGRFPANFVISRSNEKDCPAVLLNKQNKGSSEVSDYFKNFEVESPFYYCKKPDEKERQSFNTHPTVKPLKLIRYLCKMITPLNGTVLDPFMGSGTTGVAALREELSFIGIEQDSNYHQISEKRLKEALHELK